MILFKFSDVFRFDEFFFLLKIVFVFVFVLRTLLFHNNSELMMAKF